MPVSNAAGDIWRVTPQVELQSSHFIEEVVDNCNYVTCADFLDGNLPYPDFRNSEAVLNPRELLQYSQGLGVGVNGGAIFEKLGLGGKVGDARGRSHKPDFRYQVLNRLEDVRRLHCALALGYDNQFRCRRLRE